MPISDAMRAAWINDAQACECNRLDQVDNPHRHNFDWACVYWQAGVIDLEKAQSILNAHIAKVEAAKTRES